MPNNDTDRRVVFGAKLRAARLAAALSQTELAERIGSIQSYISRLERGLENPSLQMMAMLADAVGKTPYQNVSYFPGTFEALAAAVKTQ